MSDYGEMVGVIKALEAERDKLRGDLVECERLVHYLRDRCACLVTERDAALALLTAQKGAAK